MPDLKYAVTFAAVDRLTDKLSSFGGGFLNLGNHIQECGAKLGEVGESLTRFGERLSLDTMLMKDNADHLRALSDAVQRARVRDAKVSRDYGRNDWPGWPAAR